MELDELKASWQSLDRRVDELTAINRRLLTETITRKARWRLAPVLVGAVLNMIIGAWFALVWGKFWSAHLATPAVAVAGIALHLASVGLIVIGAVRLVLVLRIDYTRPVLTIQRSLATLQEFEARSFHAVWFACWVLLPAALVAHCHGICGSRSLGTRIRLRARQFRGVPGGRTGAAAAALLVPPPARQAGGMDGLISAQSQHRARQGRDCRDRRVRAHLKAAPGLRSSFRYMWRRYWPPTSYSAWLI